MIIRRKMPRISGQRSVGSTGVKMLQRSVEHARRMVVSRLPANLPPASAETSAPTPSYGNQPELLAPGAQFSDAAPVQRAPQPQASAPVHGTGDLRNSPTMPRDLQSIFNRHKAMGHVREQAGGIQAMIDSQKSQAQRSREEASKPRLQPRPENVHTEPGVQRSSLNPDTYEDLPEMPAPKSKRVMSRFDYVNVPSPDRYPQPSPQTDAVQKSDADTGLDEDDLPDALPGTFALDDDEPALGDDSLPKTVATPANSPQSPAIQRSAWDTETELDVFAEQSPTHPAASSSPLDTAIQRAEQIQRSVDNPSGQRRSPSQADYSDAIQRAEQISSSDAGNISSAPSSSAGRVQRSTTEQSSNLDSGDPSEAYADAIYRAEQISPDTGNISNTQAPSTGQIQRSLAEQAPNLDSRNPSDAYADEIYRAEQISSDTGDISNTQAPSAGQVQRSSAEQAPNWDGQNPSDAYADEIYRAEQISSDTGNISNTQAPSTGQVQRSSTEQAPNLDSQNPSDAYADEIYRAEQISADTGSISNTQAPSTGQVQRSSAEQISSDTGNISNTQAPSVGQVQRSSAEQSSNLDSQSPSDAYADAIYRAEQISADTGDISNTQAPSTGQVQRSLAEQAPNLDTGLGSEAPNDSPSSPASRQVQRSSTDRYTEAIQRAEQISPSHDQTSSPESTQGASSDAIEKSAQFADSIWHEEQISDDIVGDYHFGSDDSSIQRSMSETADAEPMSEATQFSPDSSTHYAEATQRAEQIQRSPDESQPDRLSSNRNIAVSRAKAPVIQRLPENNEVADEPEAFNPVTTSFESEQWAGNNADFGLPTPSPSSFTTPNQIQRSPEPSHAASAAAVPDFEYESSLPEQSVNLADALLGSGFAQEQGSPHSVQASSAAPSIPSAAEPVLMPPIGRTRHTKASTAPVQRSSEPSESAYEAPSSSPPYVQASRQSSVEDNQSDTNSSLLRMLGMPPDTPVQETGVPMPSVSVPAPSATPVVQRELGDSESSSSSSSAPAASASSSTDGGNTAQASREEVEKMAQKVYKILQRRFRVESERERGR